VALGITLLALGAVFLAHTLVGIQFPVREHCQSHCLILGAYMLWDYLKRRKRREELRGFETVAPRLHRVELAS
jgi:hypothetical protein